MKKLIALTLILLSFGCSKNTENDDQKLEPLFTNAKVLGKGQDCSNAYLIKLNNNFVGIPPNTTNNVFYEINLPSQYKVDNLAINVTFRLPTNTEKMVCTALGIAYPEIYIQTATIY